MARRKKQVYSKIAELNDAIQSAEESAGPDAGSALNAIYRADIVRQAIQPFYQERFDVQVYTKGSGYGVVMKPISNRRSIPTISSDEPESP